ncbi:MFS transporter [Nocardioides panacisoli]|uniref:MFS transporter n=1 Tax=Nocardioides panacisoli TaxID=627624 RepID=UPI001C62D387|nr:MFS transporter [Nocardioides panacisoli]QYJ03391.1 MFS transporter [Nocardioides panacisoli]
MSTIAPWFRVAVAMTAVGWGANHFAGLLAVYREGHSESFVSIAVGIYAAGLIPALLVTAVVGDRFDHRAPVRVAVVLSAVGTVLLAFGSAYDALLPVGRFVAGAATGIVLAPGTAWLMDLSRVGAGPRRATVALTLGFGGGPFVVGLLGQWAPAPEVLPYAAHLLLSCVAVAAVWLLPVAPARNAGAARRSWATARATVAAPTFLRTIPLTAPWVFGGAATAFAIAPGVITVTTLPVATGAVVLGLTLFTGVGVQPLAKRLEQRAAGLSLSLGTACAAVGSLVCAWAFRVEWPALLFVIALVLGAAYGLLLVGGLARVEAVSLPEDRTRVSAVFYAFSYLGFAAPYVFVLLTQHLLGPSAVMLVGAAIAAVTVATLPRPRPGAVGGTMVR